MRFKEKQNEQQNHNDDNDRQLFGHDIIERFINTVTIKRNLCTYHNSYNPHQTMGNR